LRIIAAKGQSNRPFRIWYGQADNDEAAFVLTLTPQHVAKALHKVPPISLEEMEEYIGQHEGYLREIVRCATAAGEKAKVLG
jgi:hypothetical protein